MQSKEFLALNELAYFTSAVIRPAEHKTPFAHRIYGIAERTRRGRPKTTLRRARLAPLGTPQRRSRRREGGENGGRGLPLGVDEGRDCEGWLASGGGTGGRTKGYGGEAQGDVREKPRTASPRIQGGGDSPRTSGDAVAVCGSGAIGDDNAPAAATATTVPAATHPPEGGRSDGSVTATVKDSSAGGALASDEQGDPTRWQNGKELDGIGRRLLHLSVAKEGNAEGVPTTGGGEGDYRTRNNDVERDNIGESAAAPAVATEPNTGAKAPAGGSPDFKPLWPALQKLQVEKGKESGSGSIAVADASDASAFGERRKEPVSSSSVSSSPPSCSPRRWTSQLTRRRQRSPQRHVREQGRGRQGITRRR